MKFMKTELNIQEPLVSPRHKPIDVWPFEPFQFQLTA